MAFILFHNRKPITLPHKKALLLEKIKQGTADGTPKQKAFARDVKKIYFNKDYLETADIKVPWWIEH